MVNFVGHFMVLQLINISPNPSLNRTGLTARRLALRWASYSYNKQLFSLGD